jgi:hypothetical protein
MADNTVQYKYKPGNLQASAPGKLNPESLRAEEMIVNLGPQHPSTHGVLRLELLMEGEIVKEAVPHIGYLHRCFEKHAENLPYNQVIPFVDRLDYVAAMNNEHVYAMGVERMLGIAEQIPKRVEYVRVLVAELNRIGYWLSLYSARNVWYGYRSVHSLLLDHARPGTYSAIARMGVGRSAAIQLYLDWRPLLRPARRFRRTLRRVCPIHQTEAC